MQKTSASFLLAFLLSTTWLTAQIPNGYYNSATGLSGAPLKTALYNIIKNHTVVSYTGLWTAFQTTDDKINGKVWDMYSDIPNGTPPYEYTFGSDQCGNYTGEGDCYNREHSFPKSWFNDASPMYSDLFHIVPTDGYVNSKRSNYPYGEVNSPTWTSLNGSRLGPCASAGYSGLVFEPRDEYKGDFARNYFYMATRYENVIASWQSNTGADEVLNGTSYPCYDAWFLDVLLAWNAADPVSQKEIDRNNAVYYSFQNNRNPYIDHPEYVSEVWGGTTILPEPDNHVTNFIVSSASLSSLTLTWNDNDGTQPAQKFLILANTTGNFATPADGIPVADDPDMTDNSGAANVAHGTQTCTFSGLASGTIYYFKIWPYTNSSTDINYKTNGAVPQTNGSTLLPATLSANPSSLNGFVYTVGSGPSVSKTYFISGSGLQPASGNILISGTTNYEVSINNSTFSTSATLPYSLGNLASTTVYVRLKAGLSTGAYNNENISNSGGGAPAVSVNCNGNVTAVTLPQINITSPVVNAGNVNAGTNNHILYISKFDVSVLPTTLQQISYQVNGTYNDADIKPNGFQLYGNSSNNFATALPLGSAQSSNLSSTGGLLIFNQLSTNINAGSSYYVWLSADISYSATAMHTLAAAATTNNSYVFQSGTVSGSQTAGGIQTILNATALLPGDIAFTAYQCDDPDKFAFVLLRDINPGVTINFTDNAWDESELLSNEGTIAWTSPSATLSKGTLITITVNGSATATFGSVTSSGNFLLSASGDQILAYQGTSAAPVFVAAISTGTWLGSGNPSVSTSYLPSTLSLYNTACGFGTETDNGWYSGPQTATIEALRALLNYPSNFTRSDEITVFPAWSFPLSSLTVIDANSEVQNLTINSGQSLNVNASQNFTVHGNLANNSGTQGLILKSEAYGTASLLHNSADVSATVQRFISGDPQPSQHFYHLVSVPLVQSATLTSSFLAGSYLFEFDETAVQINQAWIPLGNASNIPLNVNKGYRIYNSTAPGVVCNFTGALNAGEFEVPLSYSGAERGFNLIPNPYPSAINWDSPQGWNRPQLASAFWTWNQSIGNYSAYVSGAYTNGGNSIIPSGQAFFVKSEGATTLGMDNRVRLHSQEAFAKNAESTLENFRLTVDASGYSDEILVRFPENSSPYYESESDALKLEGDPEAPQLSALTPDQKNLSIFSSSGAEGELTIPLYFTSAVNGNVTFTGSGMESFGPLTTIYLEDMEQSHLHDFRVGPEFTFSYTPGGNAERFRLRFSNLNSTDTFSNKQKISIYFTDKQIFISGMDLTKTEAEVSVYSVSGQQLYSDHIQPSALARIKAPLAPGIYLVRLSSGTETLVRKVVVH